VLWQVMDAPTRQTPLSSIGQHQESPMSTTLCRSLGCMSRQLIRSLLVLLGTAALLAACGGSEAPLPVTTYTVSTAAGSGGAITPASASAPAGANASFSLVPDAGFQVVGASGCNGTLDAAAGTYATGAVTADCTVTVQFAAVPAATVQVTGVALDTAGRSLAGVQAYNADGVLATSDAQGRLSFDLPPSAAGAVRLRKAGYTRQTVMLDVVNAEAHFVGTLGRRNAPVTVNIDTRGADLLDDSGARVFLAPGTVVDAQGNPVTGDFQVTVTPVNVSDPQALKAFPGSYSALDMAGEPVPILMPYGTMEVLLTRGDESLNLAPGAVSAIEIPIYVTQHSDGSPITVGETGGEVWSLDEVTGLWQLETTGVVVTAESSPTGMALRAQVSHFSWWNFDYGEGPPPSESGPNNPDPNNPRRGSCRVPLSLVNLPPGNPVNAILDLEDATGTQGPAWEDSFATTLSNGQSFTIPRNGTVYIYAFTITPSGGFYVADATFSCRDADSGVTLDFEGPSLPLVLQYTARIEPVFALDAGGLNEVVGNRAELIWRVLGHTSLSLIEPELPLNMPINVASGSQEYVLTAPADPVNNRFNFKLLASNDTGSVELEESLSYITAPPPTVRYFNVSSLSATDPLQLRWDVDGADEINVGYVAIGSPPEGMTRVTGWGSGAPGFIPVPRSLLPDGGRGYSIVAEFKNRYGSTYIQRSLGLCFRQPDGSCAETD
jgi:hypothetical protein